MKSTDLTEPMACLNDHLSDLELEDILDRHQISPRYRPAFRLLAYQGKLEDPQFGLRLNVCLNYKAASDEILELLSRPYLHLFSSTPESLENL